MKNRLIFVLGLMPALLCRAQSRQPFQETIHFGTHQQYYTTTSFLPDSTVYRVDTYQLVYPIRIRGQRFDNRKVALRQGPTKIFYPTGQLYLSCNYQQGALSGPLMLFYSDGAIKRREFYRDGHLLQSFCYTSDGNEQTCQPLYQGPRFTGKFKDLERYLEKSLQPIMEHYELQALTLSLTINEIGQVTDTAVEAIVNPNDSGLRNSVQGIIQRMPQWHADRLNWQPARMDDVAVPEKQIIRIARRSGFLYVSL